MIIFKDNLSGLLSSLSGALSSLCLMIWISTSPPVYAQEDPQEEEPAVSVLSETETSYAGARLLHSGEDVTLGLLEAGMHNDVDNRDRYMFWQGDSLFLGVVDTEHDNRLDVVAEFYWFESSLPRNSDFYVIVLKVTAAPTPDTNWRISTPSSFIDTLLFRDIGAVHRVQASLDRTGQQGAIRWDWSLPFQNYRWEPERVIEIEQEYTAGAHVEGSAMRDLSEGVNVQAKGFLDAQTRVSTRYTITLWRWEMLVQAGATDMDWALIALSPEHEQDPAYHEYFLVLQSEREVPVRLNHLQFATTMRDRRPFLPDRFKYISIRLQDLVLSTPRQLCGQGTRLEGGVCVPDCPPDTELINGECQQSCSEGFELIEGQCVFICPEGYEWVDHECVLVCPPNMININDQCELLCEDGSISVNGICNPEECAEGWEPQGEDCVPICEMGSLWRDGECVSQCPPNAEFDGQRCVCPQGFELDNDQCVRVCEEGFRFDGMQCVSICGEGFHFDGIQCVPICPEGTTWVENRCMLIEQSCPRGYVWREGSCQSQCAEGLHLREGQCVQTCPEGFIWEDQHCVAECPEGTYLANGRCLNRFTDCPPGTYSEGGECVERLCEGAECCPPDDPNCQTPSLSAADDLKGCNTLKTPLSRISLFLLLLGLFFISYRERRVRSYISMD